MRRTRPTAPPVDGRFGYPLGFVTAVTVTIVTVAAHATSHPLWSVAALSVATAAGVVVRADRQQELIVSQRRTVQQLPLYQ